MSHVTHPGCRLRLLAGVLQIQAANPISRALFNTAYRQKLAALQVRARAGLRPGLQTPLQSTATPLRQLPCAWCKPSAQHACRVACSGGLHALAGGTHDGFFILHF